MAMADGLDGVIAAETVLSDVDGLAGRLVIRGHDVGAIARGWRFENVVGLLLDGFVDSLPRGDALVAAIGAARADTFERLAGEIERASTMPPIEALRALLARLPDGDNTATALRLIAAPAVLTAGLIRARQGDTPIAPDPALGHAADLLRMLGRAVSPDRAAALDAYLGVVSDHGFNASTFAARVVASTHAGLTSATVAGIGALKGPLHGGAPGPVIEMLDAIGTPERAEAWIEEALDRGERLMGFGHRIYRVRDPRADALKRVVAGLAQADGRLGRLAFAESVEAAALAILKRRKPDRPLDTNVEFYTALLLEALGFPPEAFTCVFACGRVAGWVAHAREQVTGGRLIRPQSRYVGPVPSLAA
jgi:citrate synthase